MPKTPPPGGWNAMARSRMREQDRLLHANSKPPPLTPEGRIVAFLVGALCFLAVTGVLAHELGFWGTTT